MSDSRRYSEKTVRRVGRNKPAQFRQEFEWMPELRGLVPAYKLVPAYQPRPAVTCVRTGLAFLLATVWLLTAATTGISAQALPPPAIPNVPASLTAARLDEVTGDTRAQLKHVTDLLAEQRWDEAVATWRQIMDEQGERMIRLDGSDDGLYPRYVRVRDYCHWCLSSLRGRQREALVRYRRRVDPTVRQWYQRAMRDRDPRLLRRIVDQYFTSSFGDDVLYALGEMALERGDHTGARRYWQRISPALRCPDSMPVPGTHGGEPLWLALRDCDWNTLGDQIRAALSNPPVSAGWLAYPDTEIPIADLRARLVLVSILEGSLSRAHVELAVLRHLHPRAQGKLAGKTVVYAGQLQQLLDQSRTWPAKKQPDDWATFARQPARNRAAPTAVELASSPAWTIELDTFFPPRPSDKHGGSQPPRPAPEASPVSPGPAACPYYPLVIGDQLLVHNGLRVLTIDIRTGQGQEMYPRGVPLPHADSQPVPNVGEPCYTMTALRNRLFARMGSPVTTYVLGAPAPARQGYLLGWDLQTKKLLIDKVLPGGPRWAFDGTPVADDSNLYVAMRYTDVNPQAHVACFDLRSQRLRWRTKICSADTWAHGLAQQVTHNLLTLDHGVIYSNTGLGAVAALGAEDGQVRWITRYPRAQPAKARRPAPRHRGGPAPCVFRCGVLYLAPLDSDRVFALDAANGQCLWQTTLARREQGGVLSLTVAEDRLIAAGKRLWWLSAITGQADRAVVVNPFPPLGRSTPTGLGPAVLAGDRVYWPARDQQAQLHIFDRHTGRPVRDPIPLGGPSDRAVNLLVARGYLFSVTSARIEAFPTISRSEQ